jgi:hypothetical protein
MLFKLGYYRLKGKTGTECPVKAKGDSGLWLVFMLTSANHNHTFS